MNPNFTWKEEYSIGIDEIDIQHKRLLMVIKALFELSDKEIDDKKLNNLLEELVNTFQYHFGSEEAMMVMYKYPKLSGQKIQHELMTRNVKRLMDNIKQNKIMLPQLLFNLENWFIEHDNDYDKEFGKYVSDIRSSL